MAPQRPRQRGRGNRGVHGHLSGRSGAQLVKHMVVALVLRLEHEPRLFEQVHFGAGAGDVAVGREVDLHVLAEARGVVVSDLHR